VNGYGLAEALLADLHQQENGLEDGELLQDIIDVIQSADVHTGVLGGQGHVGCRLCAAVKAMRQRYGLEYTQEEK
jgi:hypothetical protein